MGFVEPETWIYNGTQDALVFFTVNEFKQRSGEKRIKRGGYAAVSYRKGHSSAGRPRRHFLVFPENRPDLGPLKIMPSQVYQHANIKVVYKLGGAVSAQYQDGAVVGYEFEDDTMFHRIGLVRRFGQLCAKLGSCYYTTPAPAPAQASAPVGEALARVGFSATGEALVLVGAPAPVLAHDPMEAPAPVEAPALSETPAPMLALVLEAPTPVLALVRVLDSALVGAPTSVLASALTEALTPVETTAQMLALSLLEAPTPVIAHKLVLDSVLAEAPSLELVPALVKIPTAIDGPALAETPILMEAAASALLVAEGTQGSAPTLHSEMQVAVN